MDSLTLMDYSDRELLHIVLDCQDPDTGYATTKQLVEALGVTGDHAASSVGVRMAWLRRFGAVARHPKRSLWTVTLIGEQLINGDLSERQAALVDNMEADRLLMLTRAITRKYRRAGTTASHLMRREWRRGTSY